MGNWKIEKSAVMSMFPEKESRKNVEEHFLTVAAGLDFAGIHDPIVRLAAYATIRAETSSFKPITEGKSKYNTLSLPYELFGASPNGTQDWNLYDSPTASLKIGKDKKPTKQIATKKRDLGNKFVGIDGEKYIGRGFVQLTGRSNYEKYGPLLDPKVDLTENPGLANEPKYAAQILGLFIKHKEEKIRTSLLQNDYKSARRAVNGGTHGLERYTEAYKAGISEIGKELKHLDRLSKTS